MTAVFNRQTRPILQLTDNPYFCMIMVMMVGGVNPGRFGPIPVRSGRFGPGRFGPISGVSCFGPVGAGGFGLIS